jgi:hypothetical protein
MLVSVLKATHPDDVNVPEVDGVVDKDGVLADRARHLHGVLGLTPAQELRDQRLDARVRVTEPLGCGVDRRQRGRGACEKGADRDILTDRDMGACGDIELSLLTSDQ